MRGRNVETRVKSNCPKFFCPGIIKRGAAKEVGGRLGCVGPSVSWHLNFTLAL